MQGCVCFHKFSSTSTLKKYAANTKKANHIVMTKKNIPQKHLYVYGEQLEISASTNVTNAVNYCSEIKICLEKARAAF